MSEFDLITTYFTWDDFDKNRISSTVIKSVGDDAAVLSLAPNKQLVTSIDTLVSGVHFPTDTCAYDIGYKSLAVNLSDLAAMGAKPEWFTLALTLPEVDHEWLNEFSKGLKTLAQEAGIALVGGDTTSGPLSISIQVMGSVDQGKALYRSGARPGDKIYVTGTLGDGAAGLASMRSKLSLSKEDSAYCQQRLNRPTPRLEESNLIKPYASACIDVSDGLLQDLSHILSQSTLAYNKDLGAKLDQSKIPLSKALSKIALKDALIFALTGGDDYEILFTVSEALESELLAQIDSSSYQFTCIGSITTQAGIVDNQSNALSTTGYNHFYEQ